MYTFGVVLCGFHCKSCAFGETNTYILKSQHVQQQPVEKTTNKPTIKPTKNQQRPSLHRKTNMDKPTLPTNTRHGNAIRGNIALPSPASLKAHRVQRKIANLTHARACLCQLSSNLVSISTHPPHPTRPQHPHHLPAPSWKAPPASAELPRGRLRRTSNQPHSLLSYAF